MMYVPKALIQAFDVGWMNIIDAFLKSMPGRSGV
jgi:hypothetical protein